MALAQQLRFPCRSRWCALRGLAILALWIALLAGFLADVTAAQPPLGSDSQTAAELDTGRAPS